MEMELEKNKKTLKASHTVVKGLEVEKFELMRQNTDLEEKLVEARTNVERWEVRFQNSAFLEETFYKHPDFDGFAKDFSDMVFKFLMRGVAEVAPNVDLAPFKKWYAEKWTVVHMTLLVPKT